MVKVVVRLPVGVTVEPTVIEAAEIEPDPLMVAEVSALAEFKVMAPVKEALAPAATEKVPPSTPPKVKLVAAREPEVPPPTVKLEEVEVVEIAPPLELTPLGTVTVWAPILTISPAPGKSVPSTAPGQVPQVLQSFQLPVAAEVKVASEANCHFRDSWNWADTPGVGFDSPGVDGVEVSEAGPSRKSSGEILGAW